MQKDLEVRRQVLLARRQELEDISALSAAERATVTLDQQAVGRLSRMDAMQNQETAKATERSRQAELSRIARALLRIDTGDYGICDRCGGEIGARRLEVDPSALFCISCAR